MKSYNYIILILLTGLAMSSCIKGKDEPDEVENYVEVGETVPLFSVTDGAGGSFNSSQFQGKSSLLFFFSTTCPDCQRTFPSVQAVWDAVKTETDQYQVIAIARQQGKEETDRFWTDNGYTIPKYLDLDRSVYGLFANSMIPRIYLIDAQGVVTWMLIEKPVPEAAMLLELMGH